MENADFKIIYDMERFFPEKGNSNKYLESNVFKMMPRKCIENENKIAFLRTPDIQE